MLALFTTFLPLLIQIIGAIPAIQSAWNTAPKNSLQAVATAVTGALPPDIVAQLAEAGSQLFPKLSPELHAAAAALTVAHPNSTAYAQSALNLLQSSGYFSFGAPLVVDGIWGKHTKAAIIAVQEKLGLPATGILVDAEFAAIGSLLAKA